MAELILEYFAFKQFLQRLFVMLKLSDLEWFWWRLAQVVWFEGLRWTLRFTSLIAIF